MESLSRSVVKARDKPKFSNVAEVQAGNRKEVTTGVYALAELTELTG
jgi:hypothetical protein